jgi:hypothetical protein
MTGAEAWRAPSTAPMVEGAEGGDVYLSEVLCMPIDDDRERLVTTWCWWLVEVITIGDDRPRWCARHCCCAVPQLSVLMVGGMGILSAVPVGVAVVRSLSCLCQQRQHPRL